MKRERDDADSDRESSSVCDWLIVFKNKTILQALNNHLETLDILRLSCINAYMYKRWIHNNHRVAALNLRERIRDMVGKYYTKKSPVLCIRKAAVKALEPLKGGAKEFRCLYCHKMRKVRSEMVYRHICKYATCVRCFKLETRGCIQSIAFADWIEERVSQCWYAIIPTYYEEWSDGLRNKLWKHVLEHEFELNDVDNVKYVNLQHLMQAASWVALEVYGNPQVEDNSALNAPGELGNKAVRTSM